MLGSDLCDGEFTWGVSPVSLPVETDRDGRVLFRPDANAPVFMVEQIDGRVLFRPDANAPVFMVEQIVQGKWLGEHEKTQ